MSFRRDCLGQTIVLYDICKSFIVALLLTIDIQYFIVMYIGNTVIHNIMLNETMKRPATERRKYIRFCTLYVIKP